MESLGKVYLVDTNIILDNVDNIEKLSDNGENTIVVSLNVIHELDSKKSGSDELAYNAREFVRRYLNIVPEIKQSSVNSILNLVYKHENVTIIVVKNMIGYENSYNMDDKIIRDYKLFIKESGVEANRVELVTNDGVMRVKAHAELTDTRICSMGRDETVCIEYERIYDINDVLLNKEVFTIIELEEYGISDIPKTVIQLTINEGTGRPVFLVRENENMFKRWDPNNIKPIYKIKPRNLDQKKLIQLTVNENADIVVVDAIAGTGKTLMFLLSALQIIKRIPITEITYLRKTIISGDSMDELGFLPGELEDKLAPYLFPLRDNIEFIIKNRNKKKKRWAKDEIVRAIEKFENEHNIRYEYLGHLRGRTLSGVIIIDEAQNFTVQDMRTIISRIQSNNRESVLLVGGSTEQIDNPYLNKYNNGLTWLMKHIGTFNPIKILGMKMHKVERGKMVEWVETLSR